MTEAEWLACADPAPMLEFLRGKASDRKLRLFAVACCRRCWHLYQDRRGKVAVETAERYADGLATEEELREAMRLASAADRKVWGGQRELVAAQWAVCGNKMADAAGHASFWALADYTDDERGTHASLLRCIFGNSFRPLPPLPPAVLAWSDRTLPRLAQAIYEDRKMPEGTLDNSRLAILADALLDAGCEDEDLIAHCRGEGPHVRGCWVVDLILWKE
jgi:hypothetical protein